MVARSGARPLRQPRVGVAPSWSGRYALFGAFLLTLSGCAPGDTDPRYLSIATGGTGGIYYPLGGALANRLSARDSTRRYTAEVSGGSVENVNRVLRGHVDLGFAIGTTLWEAARGPAPLPQAGRLRVVAPLYPNVTHVLLGRGVRIGRLDELRGRRVSVGAPGSGTEQVARHVLAAYGLGEDDISPAYLSFSESAAALRDGAVDAAILSVGYPASAVLEALTGGGVRLVGIDAERVAALADSLPFYRPARIPAGAYPGVDAELPTLGVMNWIVARDDLPDEVAGSVLRILDEERTYLRRVNDIAGQIDLGALAEARIPLHPGTQRWLNARAPAP